MLLHVNRLRLQGGPQRRVRSLAWLFYPYAMLQQELEHMQALQQAAAGDDDEDELTAASERVTARQRDAVHWDAVAACNTLCRELCLGDAATAAAGVSVFSSVIPQGFPESMMYVSREMEAEQRVAGVQEGEADAQEGLQGLLQLQQWSQ